MVCCAFGSVRLSFFGFLRIALLLGVVQLAAIAQHGKCMPCLNAPGLFKD